MFFSTLPRDVEHLGSHSKLKRRSRLRSAVFRSSRRFNKLVFRDAPIFAFLSLVILLLHIWRDSELITTFMDKRTIVSSNVIHRPEAPFRPNQQMLHPPPYLPLAQHLKHINISTGSPSLQDMVYGEQRKTQPDLRPTRNADLDDCFQCTINARRILPSTFASPKRLKLARALTKIVTFYDISSMLAYPCAEEVYWILPLVKILRSWKPTFEHYCLVSDDSLTVDILKKYGPEGTNGTKFVRYKPSFQGRFPKVDLMFSWRGLEQFSLDDVHQVFKEVVLSGTSYTLVGSSPGQPNAKLVESSKGVYSVVRPEIPSLNVRGYPFGFNKALRVIPIMEMQLLLYNSSLMRDNW